MKCIARNTTFFKICSPLKMNPNIVGNYLMYLFWPKQNNIIVEQMLLDQKKKNVVEKFFKHNSI